MEIKRDDYLNKLITQKHNGLIKVITGMLFSATTVHNSQSNQPICLVCHKHPLSADWKQRVDEDYKKRGK